MEAFHLYRQEPRSRPPELATEMALPPWWVHGYLRAGGEQAWPLEDGVWLAQDGPGWLLWAVLIALWQRRADDTGALTVAPEEFRAICGPVLGRKKAIIDRFVLSLGSTKVHFRNGDGLAAESLFATESWGRSAEGMEVRLTASGPGRELFWGLRDGLADLLARESGASTPRDGAGPVPLMIRHAAWLELRPPEHRLLCLLERESQWGGIPVDGAGTRVLPIAEIARDLPVRSPLDAALRVLRKMELHGLLASPSGQMMALPAAELGPFLSWRPQPRGAMQTVHREWASWQLLAPQLVADPKPWLDLLTGGLAAEDALALREDVLEPLRRDPETRGARIVLAGGFVVPLWAWFAEAVARLRRGDARALADTPVLRDCCGWGGGTADYRSGFLRLVGLLAGGGSTPRDFLGLGGSLLTPGAPIEGAERAPVKVVRPQALPVAAPAAAPAPLRPVVVPPQEERRSPERDAVASLQALRTRSRGEYEQLRDRYISSLDEPSRRLMTEISQRMKPELFDRHIEARLASFLGRGDLATAGVPVH